MTKGLRGRTLKLANKLEHCVLTRSSNRKTRAAPEPNSDAAIHRTYFKDTVQELKVEWRNYKASNPKAAAEKGAYRKYVKNFWANKKS